MSTLSDTDLLLVERDGQNYQITSDQMSTLNDTDLLLVERGGVQYKMEAAHMDLGPTGAFEQPVEVLTPVNGAGITDQDPYHPISSPIVTVGAGGSVTHETSEIQSTEDVFNPSDVTSTESINTPENAIDGNPQTFASVAGAAIRVTPTGKITVPAGYSASIYCSMGGGESNVVSAEFVNAGVQSQTYTVSAADYFMPVYENTTGVDDEIIYYELERLSASGYPAGYSYSTGIAIHPNGAGPYLYTDADLVQYMVQPGATYTFTDSTNFDKFQVGDQVIGAGGISTVDYTGSGETQSIAGVGFSPDLVWAKQRNGTRSNVLFDTVRGVQRPLYSDTIDVEVVTPNSLLFFNSDGFTVGTDYHLNQSSSYNYIAWCWNAGTGGSVANNDGSIPSTVKASDETGFSIITYTGNGNQGWDVGHGLSTQPSFVIVKAINETESWSVYHSALGATQYLFLNVANGADSSSSFWNNVGPSASTITLGSHNGVNKNNANYVAYAWAETPGVSKFGSYSGNGGTNSITVGFEPAWLMVKKTNAADAWYIFDSARGETNYLYANDPAGESYGAAIAFDSNGFTWGSGGGGINASGGEYIYVAFSAEAVASITDIDELASQMALDADIKDVGDTLSKTSTFDASLICSDDTELANMIGPLTMTDENGDLVTPQTSEIQSVSEQPPYIKWLSDSSTEGWLTYDTPGGSIGPGGVTEAGYLYTDSGRASDYLVFYFSSIGVTIETDTVVQFNCLQSAGGSWTAAPTTVFTNTGNLTMSGYTVDDVFRIGCTITVPAGTTYIAISPSVYNGSNAQQNFGGLIVDGISYDLWVSSSSPDKILTFADNTDLEYFSAGDVVKDGGWDQSQAWSSYGTGTPHTSTTDWDKAFDGIITTTADATFAASDGTMTWTPSSPITVNTSVTLYIYSVTDGSSYGARVNGSYIAGTNNYNVPVTLTAAELGGQLTSIQLTNSGLVGPYLSGVEVDGKLLVSTGVSNPNAASVVSVDAPNSQMVVDGGNWASYDDSQVWSSGTTTGVIATNSAWRNAFDGVGEVGDDFSPSTLVGALPGDGYSSITFPTPVAVDPADVIKVVAYYSTQTAGDTSTGVWLTGSSGEAKVPFTPTGYTYISASLTGSDVGAFFTGFKMLGGNGDWTGVAKISINGKTLVDNVYDTQVWSNSLTGSGLTNPTNAFDGDIDSYADTSGGWSLDLSGYTFGSGYHTIAVKAGGATSITVDGSTSLTDPGGGGAKVWTGTHAGELSTIASSATGSSFYYLEIDGSIVLDQGVRDLGATSVSLPTLEASATDVVNIDGNTVQVDGVSGTWLTGLYIKGAEVNPTPPSPAEVVFTSSNNSTTPVTGTDATLSSRVWTLQSSNSSSGPWTTVASYVDTDANASQDGATPWTTNRPALSPNTYYQIKVGYTSENAVSVESIYNTFRTGDAS